MDKRHPTYVKTPKGIEEVERKTHGLALKSRQVLIMIDGKRDLAALQGIFPPDMVPEVLSELLNGGFARELAPPKPAPTAALSPDEDPFVLSQTFMINIAKKILGIAGDGVIANLKAADDLEDLRQLFPEWRTAVKQSPDGLMRMKEFESKLFQVLGEIDVTALAKSSTVKPAPEKPKNPPTNDDERFVLARNFMINSTKNYLGLAARDFVHKVEATETIGELRQLFFDWRAAMKQSPEAKRSLADYESKLAALLS